MRQVHIIASLAVILCFGSSLSGQTRSSQILTAASPTSTADFIKSAEELKKSAEEVVSLQQTNVEKLTASVAQLRELYKEGLIARRELENAEQELAAANAQLEQAKNQRASADQLIADMKKAEELAKASKPKQLVKPVLKSINPIGAVMMRSESGNWSLSDLPQVQRFFSGTFGHPLPISTIGQSTTHNRMGWDHRNSVDVGVHPDSAEGQALMSYLQTNGIPFLAFRAAIPGVATGPHIHIGFPSHRLA